MTVVMLLLMAYSLIGEAFHEVIGTAIFVLFIGHHILNRGWYKALPKGRYSALRIFQTVLDVLLLLVMITQPLSGILMSKHLYTFLPVSGVSATAREIHLMFAYWGLVLMSKVRRLPYRLRKAYRELSDTVPYGQRSGRR